MTLLELDAAIDPQRCGHKAATLAALRRSGHLVPDGFVIPVGTALDPELLERAIERMGNGKLAVRSSGVAEDLPDASYAGRYETVLGVDSVDDVVAAARRVVDSARGESAMGVLVQRLVAAEAAGVAFTTNPVTGDDEVVIEATRGLGAELLSGAADGERWIVRDGRAQAQGEPSALSEPSARRIAELARRIAGERGGPQDVEWALEGGKLFVLQARPITSVPVRPAIEFPPGRWMKDVSHFSGPMTPVGASLLLPCYERAFEPAFAEFGVPLLTIRQRAFGGEVYTQDVDVSGKHDPSAPPPWWVLAIAVRVVPVLRRRMAAARDSEHKLDAYPRRWESSWRDECTQRIEQARSVSLDALGDEALLTELERLIEQVLLPHLIIHFQLTIPYMVGVCELARCCQELLGWDLAQVMQLLTGISSATTAPARALQAIDGPGLELDAWVQRWGLRTIDSDPGSPMIAECEELIAGLIASQACSSGAAEAERQLSIERARKALNGVDRARFEHALAYAELVYPQRDDNVVYTEGLPSGLIRRVLLEMGRRLHAAGKLEAPGDVVFLRMDELGDALGSAASWAGLVRRRRAEQAWVVAHPGALIVGPAPVPDPDLRGLPAPARRIMEAAAFAMAQELTPPAQRDDADGTLLGVGVSPGAYTGRVRVILSEADLERLRPGEVLVCPTTHSSWNLVFRHAGALVTNGGGMLSHPAIIAREHGIPAVAATGNATARLRDGDRVTVDGSAGRVMLRAALTSGVREHAAT